MKIQIEIDVDKHVDRQGHPTCRGCKLQKTVHEQGADSHLCSVCDNGDDCYSEEPRPGCPIWGIVGAKGIKARPINKDGK